MNGYLWRVFFVEEYSPLLVDRTGRRTVATTDPSTLSVYLSNSLYGDFLIKVILHEIGHCALFSFGLLDDIHRIVIPQYWIFAEESICNFMADYGKMIFDIAYKIYGNSAWRIIPYEIENIIY